MQYIKQLRFAALILRILSFIFLLIAFLSTGEMFINRIGSGRLSGSIIFYSVVGFLQLYAVPTVLWIMSLALYALAAMIVDMDKMRQQLLTPAPRKKTDEQLYGLRKTPHHPEPISAPPVENLAPVRASDERFAPPRQKAKVDSNQPPRQKIDKRPRLTPRLYSIRWQGGKAQRAVRKTVIE